MSGGIQSYLPQLLLDWYADNRGRRHVLSEHRGILLFADASGFTALTRRLAQQGRDGSETLTRLLNRVFTTLNDVADAHHGDILKFSGDAVWCCFPEDTSITECFAEMLESIAKLNRIEPICHDHPIGLHAGAARGSFKVMSLGDADNRLEFELLGDIVSNVYQAADIASSGKLVIHESLIDHCEDMTPLRCDLDGFYLLRLEPRAHNRGLVGSICGRKMWTDDESYVARYIPEMVRKRLSDLEGAGQLASEHRRVSVLFAALTAATPDKHQDLDRTVRTIFASVRNLGGSVARMDPFKSGHKLLVLFGALARGSHDEIDTLQAAREIADLSSSQLRISVGLASGHLFCGEVGSESRLEYTVMGEAVNLAARLMSKADAGGILMDEVFLSMAGGTCKTRARNFGLKGVGNDVTVHEFVALRQAEDSLPDISGFVGRTELLARLRSLCAGSQTVVVTGEPGIGKTAACVKLAEEIASDSVLYISAASSKLHQPGHVIRAWIKRSLEKRASNERSALGQLESLGLLDARWRPLLADLLGDPCDDNEWTIGLSPELRLERTAEVTREVLARVPRQPRLMLLDDLESADSFSLSLLNHLVQGGIGESQTLVLIGSTLPKELCANNCALLEVTGLTASEMDEFLRSRMGHGRREKELIELIKSKAEGSPLFLRQALDHLIAGGAVATLSSVDRLEVVKPLGEIELAPRLEDLQLSVFDRLPETLRTLLKAASVLGEYISPESLVHLIPDMAPSTIAEGLSALTERDLLRRVQGTEYAFKRVQTREAIYGCIPSSDRRAMHRLAGELLQSVAGRNGLSQLAYHFARSDDLQSGFRFSLDAGSQAKSKQMLIEAADHFQRCQEIVAADTATLVDDDLRLRYYHLAGEFAVLEGDYHHAYRMIREGRRLARRICDRRRHLSAANDFAGLLWRQSRFARLRQTLNLLLETRTEADPDILSRTYSILAEFNRRVGKFAEAQSACREAIQLAHQAGDVECEASAYNNLGLACWGGGDLAGAREAFETGMNLGLGNLGKYAEAKAANNLAIIAEEMGDYIEAERLLQKARAIFADIGDRRNASYSSGNLANILTCFGRYREALDLFRAADRVFLKLGEEHPHYYTLGNIGDIELVLGDSRQALDNYRLVAEFARQSGDRELDAETKIRMAEYEFYCGDVGKARTLYQDSVALATEIGSCEFQTRGAIGLCRLLIGEKEAAAAQEQIDRLHEYATQTRSDRTRFEAVFLEGEKARIVGDTRYSLQKYDESLQYSRSQNQFELSLKCLVRISELSRDKKDTSIDELRRLSADFALVNSDGFLQKLLNSPYYRFFAAALTKVVTPQLSADSPQPVG